MPGIDLMADLLWGGSRKEEKWKQKIDLHPDLNRRLEKINSWAELIFKIYIGLKGSDSLLEVSSKGSKRNGKEPSVKSFALKKILLKLWVYGPSQISIKYGCFGHQFDKTEEDAWGDGW